MFYINSDVGADYTDSMYGAVEKNDEIIFKMYFMGGNNLIAIGDRNITSISAAGVEEGSVEVTNEIMGVGLCGNKIAMIYGEELSDKEGELPGTIVFVSSGGKLSTGDSAEVETWTISFVPTEALLPEAEPHTMDSAAADSLCGLLRQPEILQVFIRLQA